MGGRHSARPVPTLILCVQVIETYSVSEHHTPTWQRSTPPVRSVGCWLCRDARERALVRRWRYRGGARGGRGVSAWGDAAVALLRTQRGYRNVPVDDDAQILRFADEEES